MEVAQWVVENITQEEKVGLVGTIFSCGLIRELNWIKINYAAYIHGVWLIDVHLRILRTAEVSAAKQSKTNHTLCTLRIFS